jgi:single-stranded DNA-binding protein
MTAPIPANHISTFDTNVPEGCDPMPVFPGHVRDLWSGQVGANKQHKLRFTLVRTYPFYSKGAGGEEIGTRYYAVEIWADEAERWAGYLQEGDTVYVAGEPTYFEDTYTPKNSTEEKTRKGIKFVSARIVGHAPADNQQSGDEEF